MRPVHRSLVFTLSVATLAGTRQVRAQTPNIRVSGRTQTHYSTVGGDSSSNFNPNGVVTTAFEVRRLRIQADVRVGENVFFVIQPSFEMASLRMRDAYLRVGLVQRPDLALSLTMGQEKKPFNRYELASSNTLPSIERGARFRGFTGAMAQNNLLEAEGYLAQDIGASLDAVLAQNRVQLRAGMYNGSGESAADVNNAKTFVMRGTATVLADAEARPVLRLGAALLSRDRAITSSPTATTFAPDSLRRTGAVALDLEYGDFRPGLHVIADVVTGTALRGGAHCLNAVPAPISCRFDTGRNTGNVRPNAPDSAFGTFRSLHVVASWRWQPEDPSGTRLIKIIEPALRIDLSDADTDTDNTGGMLITPAVSLHFTQTTLMRAGLDLYRYRDAAGASQSVRAFRVSWQSNF